MRLVGALVGREGMERRSWKLHNLPFKIRTLADRSVGNKESTEALRHQLSHLDLTRTLRLTEESLRKSARASSPPVAALGEVYTQHAKHGLRAHAAAAAPESSFNSTAKVPALPELSAPFAAAAAAPPSENKFNKTKSLQISMLQEPLPGGLVVAQLYPSREGLVSCLLPLTCSHA